MTPRLKAKIIRWGVIAGSLSALFVLADQVWGFASHSPWRPLIKFEFDDDNFHDEQTLTILKHQIGTVADSVNLLKWDLLYSKMKMNGPGTLTFQELQELCKLAKQLEYHIPECPS